MTDNNHFYFCSMEDNPYDNSHMIDPNDINLTKKEKRDGKTIFDKIEELEREFESIETNLKSDTIYISNLQLGFDSGTLEQLASYSTFGSIIPSDKNLESEVEQRLEREIKKRDLRAKNVNEEAFDIIRNKIRKDMSSRLTENHVSFQIINTILCNNVANQMYGIAGEDLAEYLPGIEQVMRSTQKERHQYEDPKFSTLMTKTNFPDIRKQPLKHEYTGLNKLTHYIGKMIEICEEHNKYLIINRINKKQLSNVSFELTSPKLNLY